MTCYATTGTPPSGELWYPTTQKTVSIFLCCVWRRFICTNVCVFSLMFNAYIGSAWTVIYVCVCVYSDTHLCLCVENIYLKTVWESAKVFTVVDFVVRIFKKDLDVNMSKTEHIVWSRSVIFLFLCCCFGASGVSGIGARIYSVNDCISHPKP